MLSKEFISFLSLVNKEKRYFIFLFFYSFLLLFFCSTFSPLYGFNFWADINIYYTIGKGILFDKVPYRDLFDHKGPLIFFIYALGYLISPDSFFGMFIVESLFLFVSLVFVYLLSRLFLNNSLSTLSVSIFPVLLFFYTGSGGSAEEFILTFLLVSLFFFIYYFKYSDIPHNPRMMFIHGLMLSSVFFIKLNLIVFWFFPLLFIFLNLLINKRYKNFIINFLSIVLGCLFIVIPIFFYFSSNNALDATWDAYITLNSKYGRIDIISYWSFFLGLVSRFYTSFKLDFIGFSLLVFGVLYFSSFLNKKLGRVALILSFISTLIVLYSSPSIMLYYYIAYCVFIPLGSISILYILDRKLNLKYVIVNRYAIVGVFLCLFFCVYKKNLFDNSIEVLFSRKFPETTVSVITDEILKSDNQTLLCIGLDEGLAVFTMAKIIPNTKYFFSPNIKYEDYPLIVKSQLCSIDNKDINFVIMTEDFRYRSMYESSLFNNGYLVKLKYSNYLLYQLLH